MKAILVIDLPVALEHLLGEELLLHISHMDCRYIMTETAVLRPLPEEKEIRPIPKGQTHYQWMKNKHEIIGWNKCLERIKK